MDSWKQSLAMLVAAGSLLVVTDQSYTVRWGVIGLAVVTPGYGGAVVFGRSAVGFVGGILVASSALWVLLYGPPAAVTSYLLGGLIGITALDLARHAKRATEE